MSTLSNEDFAGAFDHMSSLLISQKVVQGEADEAALLTAMEKIAKRLAETDMQSKKAGEERAITPDRFVGRTMGRMGECGMKCKARIEAQRKKQYNDVVSHYKTSLPSTRNPANSYPPPRPPPTSLSSSALPSSSSRRKSVSASFSTAKRPKPLRKT